MHDWATLIAQTTEFDVMQAWTDLNKKWESPPRQVSSQSSATNTGPPATASSQAPTVTWSAAAARELLDYILRQWWPIRKQFIAAYTNEHPHLGNQTSSRV